MIGVHVTFMPQIFSRDYSLQDIPTAIVEPVM